VSYRRLKLGVSMDDAAGFPCGHLYESPLAEAQRCHDNRVS